MNYEAPKSADSIDEEIKLLEAEINNQEQGILDVGPITKETKASQA